MSKSVDEKIKEFAAQFKDPKAQEIIYDMVLERAQDILLENAGKRVLYSLVQKGKLELDVAAEEAGVDVEEFEKEMIKAGYKVPELV